MGDPAIAPNERYTYSHYLTWPDEERWEIIEGCAWAMSPAPQNRHQEIAWRLSILLGSYLKGKPCKAFAAPFDVLLPHGDEADDEVDTVVQPDIAVFCDRSKLTVAGARGAPDLAVEILSPSTSKKTSGKIRPLRKARSAGVLDNRSSRVECLDLPHPGRGRLRRGEAQGEAGDTSPIESSVLEGFVLDPVELFADLD